MSSKHNSFYAQRHYFVLLLLALLFVGLVGRAAWLQVVQQDFLLDEGSQRQLRVLTTPAYRGSILDREGHPLAISTPVDSVWANPKQALLDKSGLKQTARLLKLDYAELLKRLQQRASREFVYIKRRVEPELAKRAADAAEGVYLQREYDRFYPAGEVVAQVVGFTNIDGIGQEGLERVHEQQLRAVPGKRKVIRNRKGEVVENIAQIRAARPGEDVVTSIDMRLQYLAYRSLAATNQALHPGRGPGSGVVRCAQPHRHESRLHARDRLSDPRFPQLRRPRPRRDSAQVEQCRRLQGGPGHAGRETVAGFSRFRLRRRHRSGLPGGLQRLPQSLQQLAPPGSGNPGLRLRDVAVHPATGPRLCGLCQRRTPARVDADPPR